MDDCDGEEELEPAKPVGGPGSPGSQPVQEKRRKLAGTAARTRTFARSTSGHARKLHLAIESVAQEVITSACKSRESDDTNPSPRSASALELDKR